LQVSLKGSMQSAPTMGRAVSVATPAAPTTTITSAPMARAFTSAPSIAKANTPVASPAVQPKFTPSSKPVSAAPSPAPTRAPAASSSSAEPPSGEIALLKAWYAQQKEIEELKKKLAQLGA
jgi:hypothetical protein